MKCLALLSMTTVVLLEQARALLAVTPTMAAVVRSANEARCRNFTEGPKHAIERQVADPEESVLRIAEAA